MEQDRADATVNDQSTSGTENPAACRWCGHFHGPRCPWVKAIEFDLWDKITRVEFLTPADCGKPEREAEPEGEYPRKGGRGAQG